MPLPHRLARLPAARTWNGGLDRLPGADVRVAAGPLARLLGLAFLRRPPARAALLLPRTRCVHTFGMRFALDLHWLDSRGALVRIDRNVPPRRLRACRSAAAILEVPVVPQ
jgi:uncharacterized membrane protein (UPF0127 family)